MNNRQFRKIIYKLAKWREERHLSLENQEANLIGNVLEEIVEFTRAKDDNERIDALCDMLVFIGNTLTNYEIGRYKDVYAYLKGKKHISSLILRCYCLTLGEEHTKLFFIKEIILIIDSLGYNPYLCMLETIKEISSRTGKWDDDIKKFVKYDGIYVDNIPALKESMTIEFENDTEIILSDGVNTRQLVKWYRADYSKCKGV